MNAATSLRVKSLSGHTAELFAFLRDTLLGSSQKPKGLALAIATSSSPNSEIMAERRTPPDTTQSAILHRMS